MRKQLIAVLALLLLTGCSNRSATPGGVERPDEIPEVVKIALEKAPELELLSLDPKHRDAEYPSVFPRRKVIGKTIVTDAVTRRKLLDALDHGVRTPAGAPVACFDPRHAIRVRYEDKTYYLTICFECKQVCAFVDDRYDGELGFRTANSPEPTFDEVLSAAGIPLAKKGMLQD